MAFLFSDVHLLIAPKFLEVCFCGDKSVNFKKKHPEESHDSKCSAGDVLSLSQKHHLQNHYLFVHKAIKQMKNQYIIYLSMCGKVQESEKTDNS